ncbi:DNA polymerase/3'-5' exonuclease PolX [candidate division WWE3 bacterium]|jgi:DNA polymerase (family X)|nr:DNA polymerase/3'-5' exonuclease PolX [candidate division WWE3 bacterium]MBT7349396.1 DNA polymerase/3'-5' exonuclease PolX [candidate division WWE3 bacterium]
MSNRLSNADVVKQLKEALAAMEIKGNNRFSIRAYQNAIASIDSLTSSVYDLWENDRLHEIAGVGGGLAQHLNDLFTTGKVGEWDLKKKALPEGMFELLVLRGVGPKTAFKLAKEFGITDRENALEIVKKAAKAKKIQQLPRFGEKSEKEILASLEELKKSKNEKPRMLLSHAEEIAERVVKHLKKLEHVEHAIPLGSLRRRKSTVGDLDFAVSSTKPEEVIKHFVKFEEIRTIETQGENMSTVLLTNDTQVDILVTPPEALGALLQHFTGSKQHNIALRKLALEQGKSLSQHGIKVKGKIKPIATEEKFYEELGLPWITPELREGMHELEIAKKRKLPNLIELKDIKGDLHVHTTDSDGVATLYEMVEKAKKLGYEYLGIADHAPSVQSRGRFEVLGILEQKRKQIEKINETEDIRVLYGYEVNILKDSSLGMPDDILEKLDFVIAAIHTSFDQPRDEITARMISAIENPLVDIIGHPSGRLINEREACDLDWTKVFAAAKKHDKILEINSHPTRLDLADHLVHDAIRAGIKIIVNTDAHSTSDMDLLRFGVDVARRGWCESSHVINTLDRDNLLKMLKKVV